MQVLQLALLEAAKATSRSGAVAGHQLKAPPAVGSVRRRGAEEAAVPSAASIAPPPNNLHRNENKERVSSWSHKAVGGRLN